MSPFLVIFRIAIIMFVVEGLIMLAFPLLPRAFQALATRSDWIMAAADAVVLVLVSSPLVYLWVIRPFVVARIKAESVSAENEGRLNEAQRIARVGSWELDLRNDALIWSDEIFRIFEIDPARFGASYEAFLDAIHPEDRERVNQAYTRSLADRAPYEIAHRLRMADGRVKWVHECCETEFDADGKPLISRGTIQDITELRQAEEALRESEERLSAVVNHAPAKIHIKDSAGRYVLVNRVSEKLFGVTEDEARGKTTREIFPDAVAEKFMRHDSAVLQSGQAIEEEEEWPGEDGNHTYLTVKFPIRDASGQVSAVGAIGTDITARKKAEQALRESEERFRAIVDNSLNGITIKDENGRLLFVNGTYAAWLNADVESLIGRAVSDLLPVSQAQEIVRTDRQVVAGHRDEIRVYEEKSPFADGITRDLLIHKVPIQLDYGKIRAVITIMTDLSEFKETESKLHRAQKMEAVGQLTGGIAHDFNNLLTVIQGNLELTAYHLDDPKLNKMIQSALKASRRGAELTQHLLAFSRRQMLVPEAVQLDELVSGMCDLMRRTLGETIEISVVGYDGLWNCNVDPGQLENAILNLALNARDAMPQGGKLTIRTENLVLKDPDMLTPDGVPAGDYVMVSVTDTGTGMTPDELEHAFEPFFTTKGVGEGSGLGLSMVQGFIIQSQGFVSIDSAVGEGTSVKMYLPRAVEAGEPAPPRETAEEAGAEGELVLVVEDDPDVRDFTVTLLNSLGYETVDARDGPEAIEIMRNVPGINLLFTDVVLPGTMSGVDIAKAARKLNPCINILFTSGYADAVLDRHGLRDQDIRLIKKPFEKAALAHSLRAALDQPARMAF